MGSCSMLQRVTPAAPADTAGWLRSGEGQPPGRQLAQANFFKGKGAGASGVPSDVEVAAMVCAWSGRGASHYASPKNALKHAAVDC